VSQLNAVGVEITVLLGRSLMPMQQLLRMGRGAVIHLDSQENDEVWILANNHPIARGELVVEGDKISVQITKSAAVRDYFATEQ
jgi:flagellar motor switch protein FliN/FliY